MRGMGRIFKMKGSQNLWIAYCHRGKEYRESCGSPDLGQAKRLLKQRLRETAADCLGAKAFVGPQQERLTMKDLLDALEADYEMREIKSLRRTKRRLAQLREAMGHIRAVDFSTAKITQYVKQRTEEGRKPATINRETEILRAALRLAAKRHELSSVPEVPQLREDNVRQGFFEQAEFNAVLEHLPDYLKGFARFGYLTGWRKGEIQSLLWSDVDGEARVVRLRPENSKSGEGRILALEGELWELIDRQGATRQYKRADGTVGFSLYVFHRKGAPIGDFGKAWATACKKGNVPGKIFHDLRRTAIRNMIRASVPERIAMCISGHKTRAIFDRYNIVSEEDLRQAAIQTQTYLKSIQSKSKVAIIGKRKETGDES